MRTSLKVVGYVLLALFSIDVIYIISGLASAGHSLDDLIWHFIWAAGMVVLGIHLVTRKPRLEGETSSKSRFLGVLSLLFGIVGLFWWGAVLGIITVVLALLQFRRHTSKIAIAGLCLGVFDFILAAIWYDLGLMPSIF